MDKEIELTPVETALVRFAQAELAVWTPQCLEPEMLVGLLEEGIRYPDGARLLAHVATCAYCRHEFAELKALIQLGEQVRSSQGIAEVPTEQPEVGTIRERPWLQAGNIPWFTRWQEQIEQVLDTLTNPIPRSVLRLGGAALTGQADPIEETLKITLLSPITTRVMTNFPTFTWEAVEGVLGYDLTIIAPDSPNDLTEITGIRENHWVSEKPLQWGREYQWSISLSQFGKAATSSIASFQVARQEQAEEIVAAVEQYAGQPLELGILYAQAGLLDAAEQEYAKIADVDPRAEALWKDLRDARAGR